MRENRAREERCRCGRAAPPDKFGKNLLSTYLTVRKRRLDALQIGMAPICSEGLPVIVSSSSAASSTSFPASAQRRKLAIEDILRWVVRDELPKRHDDDRHYISTGGSIHPMWRHGVFGARIENWSREPGMPLAAGDPHPDALVVEDAMAELENLIKAAQNKGELGPLDLSGYEIGAGLGPNLDLAPIYRRAISGVVPWLLTIAKRGGLPDWGTGPVITPVRGSRGGVTIWKSVEEVVGEGKDGTPWVVKTDRVTEAGRGGFYSPGSFCKVAWSRDVRMVAEDRAQYAAWHAGLHWLAERLSGSRAVETNRGTVEVPRLSSVIPKAPAAPATPWLTPPTVPTVLRAVESAANDVEPAKPVKREGLGRRKPEPVRRIDPATYPLAA